MRSLIDIFRLHNWYVKNRPILSFRRLAYCIFLISKRIARLDYSYYPPSESQVPIDVFMPTIEKDAYMLSASINGIRKNVMHPISNIYIVAPTDAKHVRKIAKDNKCTFIDEASVLPIKKENINYTVNGENRGGWIFKMLLNLSADKICSEENILILDSDTVFIRPQIFIYNGKPLFNLSSWHHQPYYDANERLLNLPHKLPLSFITHYMLFNSLALRKLRNSIEKHSHVKWYVAIINSIDKKESSGFADYEIYGDYFKESLRWPCILNYYSNKSLGIDNHSQLSELIKSYQKRFSSLSLHNYNRN